MQLSWSARRKLVYSGAAFVLIFLILVWVWAEFFSAPPTCFDGRQNGSETGVDCGGTCALVCQQASNAPRVLWARAFPNSGAGLYTLAANIENPNPSAGAHGVHYAFQLYDDTNQLVLEKDGVADLPPVQDVPIVEPQVDVGRRTVARVVFSFNDTYPIVWHVVPQAAIPQLHISRQQLSQNGSRLDVTVDNNSIFDAPTVTLVAVLFDATGVAKAASKSVVPSIAHKSSQDVTFTWPQSNQNIARTDITILPSF